MPFINERHKHGMMFFKNCKNSKINLVCICFTLICWWSKQGRAMSPPGDPVYLGPRTSEPPKTGAVVKSNAQKEKHNLKSTISYLLRALRQFVSSSLGCPAAQGRRGPVPAAQGQTGQESRGRPSGRGLPPLLLLQPSAPLLFLSLLVLSGGWEIVQNVGFLF